MLIMLRLADGNQYDAVLFEESVMSIAPAALLLIIAPFRLVQLYSQDIKLRPDSVLHAFKLV
jgi:hypothetical protein